MIKINYIVLVLFTALLQAQTIEERAMQAERKNWSTTKKRQLLLEGLRELLSVKYTSEEELLDYAATKYISLKREKEYLQAEYFKQLADTISIGASSLCLREIAEKYRDVIRQIQGLEWQLFALLGTK